MIDVTIDTNVWAHAANPNAGDNLQDEAVTFLQSLLGDGVTTAVCFDEGWHPEPAHNRSGIWSEYLQFALPGNVLAQQILARLFREQRVTEKVISGLGSTVNKKTRELVRDPTDRKFVKVAHRSESAVLVTHDFKCFPEDVCRELDTKLGVVVRRASTCAVG